MGQSVPDVMQVPITSALSITGLLKERMMPDHDSLAELSSLLNRHIFTSRQETAIQDGIESLLRAGNRSFTRERILARGDRPDFLVDGVAIEVKVGGSRTEIARQLQRYALHDAVTAILLVTTKTQHVTLTGQMAGKPVQVVVLAGALA